MKLLSSHDEMLLLAILSLGDNAYGLTIRKEVSRATGKDWSIGAIYDPLYRLEKKGYVESSLTEPTTERGGRSKRVFSVTSKGSDALRQHKAARDNLWQKIPEKVFNKP
ncbi:MAG: PadR family transcriptional regulator [Candidatus Aminicenantes bacterium]|jgi:DNA-binding PadR family transcriptional regulator